jgi:serine/threonine protein kinase
LQETVGVGGTSQVKRGIHKKTGEKVAIKIVNKKELGESKMEMLRREIQILKVCQHPNITLLIDIFEDYHFIFIGKIDLCSLTFYFLCLVMEYLEGGDMFHYLEARDFRIKEERVIELLHSVTTALYYLHSYGIIHRDIKLQNIMMTDGSDTADAKLMDFGFSHILGPSQTSAQPIGTQLNIYS